MSNESKSKSNNLQSFSSTGGTSNSDLSSKEELREQKVQGVINGILYHVLMTKKSLHINMKNCY